MAHLEPYRSILAESVVFQGLNAADLDPVLAASSLVALAADELVLSEGAPGKGLFIVLDGEVEVFLGDLAPGGVRRSAPVLLNLLGPGRCLGEYSLIDDRPSSASARTLIATCLCFVPKASFRELVESHDRVGRIVYRNLLRFLVSRLRDKDRELDFMFVTIP